MSSVSDIKLIRTDFFLKKKTYKSLEKTRLVYCFSGTKIHMVQVTKLSRNTLQAGTTKVVSTKIRNK